MKPQICLGLLYNQKMTTVEEEWQRQLREYSQREVEVCPMIETCDHVRAETLTAKTIKLLVCQETYRDCQWYRRAMGFDRG